MQVTMRPVNEGTEIVWGEIVMTHSGSYNQELKALLERLFGNRYKIVYREYQMREKSVRFIVNITDENDAVILKLNLNSGNGLI